MYDLVASGIVPASETPLNREIGPHRRFEYFAQDLARVKAVKDKLGGTLNDVVLATVAGGVRRFLKRRRVDVARLDFRATTPVSLRPGAGGEALGNRVSAWILPLPLAQADPGKRLARDPRDDAPTQGIEPGARGRPALRRDGMDGHDAALARSRLQTIGRPHNLIVTNVPGRRSRCTCSARRCTRPIRSALSSRTRP